MPSCNRQVTSTSVRRQHGQTRPGRRSSRSRTAISGPIIFGSNNFRSPNTLRAATAVCGWVTAYRPSSSGPGRVSFERHTEGSWGIRLMMRWSLRRVLPASSRPATFSSARTLTRRTCIWFSFRQNGRWCEAGELITGICGRRLRRSIAAARRHSRPRERRHTG
jgi:hypothetical protein